MKNAIIYFYNINIDTIRMIGNDYYFCYDNKKFILQQIDDEIFDYQAILELNKLLLNNNKTFFRIIPNIKNEIITQVYGNKYVLIVDNGLSDRLINFYDILDANIVFNKNDKTINRLNRTNWIDMWKKKIDYFEVFINHDINKYHKINKHVNYFIGLGEIAISYVKNTLEQTKPGLGDELVVSHKRIKENNLKQLYNPLNLIIDYHVRDVAEYLRNCFFERHIDSIDNYINSINLTEYGARLLFGRMFFPSFFFDMFEELVKGTAKEGEVLNLIELMNDYELFLFKLYKILKNKHNIPEIKWLKKVDYSSTLTTPITSGTSFISIDSIPSLSVTSIMLQ